MGFCIVLWDEGQSKSLIKSRKFFKLTKRCKFCGLLHKILEYILKLERTFTLPCYNIYACWVFHLWPLTSPASFASNVIYEGVLIILVAHIYISKQNSLDNTINNFSLPLPSLCLLWFIHLIVQRWENELSYEFTIPFIFFPTIIMYFTVFASRFFFFAGSILSRFLHLTGVVLWLKTIKKCP